MHGLFSSCGEWGAHSSCGVQTSHYGGFSCCGAQALGTWVSGVAAHRLQSLQLLGSSAQAYLLCGMWNPPGSVIEPMSPPLAGIFLTPGTFPFVRGEGDKREGIGVGDEHLSIACHTTCELLWTYQHIPSEHIEQKNYSMPILTNPHIVEDLNTSVSETERPSKQKANKI